MERVKTAFNNSLLNLIITAATFLIAFVGLFFTMKEYAHITVWLPSGFLFALFLTYGRRILPAVIFSSILITLFFSPFYGTIRFLVLLLNPVILVATIYFGAWLFKRQNGTLDFYKNAQHVARFALTALAMAAFAAFWGALSRVLILGLPFEKSLMIFHKWLFGDLLSYLIITPLFFSFKENHRVDYTLGRFVELISIVSLTFVFVYMLFNRAFKLELMASLPFMVIPLIMLIAFRFTERESLLSVLIISAVGSWSGHNGYGPFYFGNPDLSLIILQLYISVIAFVALSTSAIVLEKRRIRQELQSVSETLEKRVSKRTRELANLNKELLIEVNNRKRIEKALKENDKRLNFILDNVNDGIFTLDTKGEFLFVTPSVKELFRFTCHKETNNFLQLIYEEDQAAAEALLQKILRGEIPVARLEYRVRCANKADIWHATTLTREIDQEGHVVLIGVCKDVTQQKAAEEEKQKLEEQVRNAAKLESLGVLAGGIAHDFNNMLTAIMGNCGLARMQVPQTSKAGRHLSNIEKASLKASELCQQLLAYSGKGKFIVQPININQVIRDMMNLLKVSISPKIDISFDMDEQLPAIKADVAQIQQVIMNVITNASEAIGDQPGEIHITTRPIHCDRAYLDNYYMGSSLQEGHFVLMQVRDTGSGMDKETLEKIFDPFFTTKFTGRGLGLAAVLGILRAHDASVKIDSEPGKGTTFSFIFPQHTTEQPVKERPHAPATATEDMKWDDNTTILLVDDDEAIREISRQTLEQAGLKVITADDGQKAVEIYSTRPNEIKLVLMDMTMPRLNGREALELMRQIKRDVPVILSSGYSEQDATQKIKENNQIGFLQKPYKPEDLLKSIQPFLSRE